MNIYNIKKTEICAASVLFYKNKILLLYDRNNKHYDQAQGHQHKKESLKETALREAREETGFSNLKLLRKLGKYQYHYKKQSGSIIYKIIHIYLVEIVNLKRIKKVKIANENFSNHFFTPDQAIKKVKWWPDKKYITLALKYLKDKGLN